MSTIVHEPTRYCYLQGLFDTSTYSISKIITSSDQMPAPIYGDNNRDKVWIVLGSTSGSTYEIAKRNLQVKINNIFR